MCEAFFKLREKGLALCTAHGDARGDLIGLGGDELQTRLSESGLDTDELGGESTTNLETLAGQPRTLGGLLDREASDT